MNLVQDEIIYPEQLYSAYQRSDDPIPELSEPESQDPLEVPLKPGQRTKILLDTAASVSIMSLDLARRLKLKLRTHRQIKVSGLGGVTTYIITHARVKITL
ncbi:hypothetical protein PHMEG_00024390 [Phytophthora megakarya]|uniref:Peptidase A2 domain-containing protein n=1 Tax=Phytophthora megakarya TaxID=4795 RepID=A0A225VFB6_9STRA|nr:hypothetical protein PHMEG_00024390 [Phytophthora megakarya]